MRFGLPSTKGFERERANLDSFRQRANIVIAARITALPTLRHRQEFSRHSPREFALRTRSKPTAGWGKQS